MPIESLMEFQNLTAHGIIRAVTPHIDTIEGADRLLDTAKHLLKILPQSEVKYVKFWKCHMRNTRSDRVRASSTFDEIVSISDPFYLWVSDRQQYTIDFIGGKISCAIRETYDTHHYDGLYFERVIPTTPIPDSEMPF